MGEAKRRKSMDSNYGKGNPIEFKNVTKSETIRIWEETNNLLEKSPIKRPDYGTMVLKQFGVRPIKYYFNSKCCTMFSMEKSPINHQIYYNLSFSLLEGIASAFITKNTFDKWFKSDGEEILVMVPCVQDRYLNPAGDEWILPLYEFREGIDTIVDIDT